MFNFVGCCESSDDGVSTEFHNREESSYLEGKDIFQSMKLGPKTLELSHPRRIQHFLYLLPCFESQLCHRGELLTEKGGKYRERFGS